jgi:hypothetical protein
VVPATLPSWHADAIETSVVLRILTGDRPRRSPHAPPQMSYVNTRESPPVGFQLVHDRTAIAVATSRRRGTDRVSVVRSSIGFVVPSLVPSYV